MRHRKAFRKLGRTTSHRRALYANMAMALVENGRITTTDAKAKELRRYAERLVTMGKDGSLAARRRAYATLGGTNDRTRGTVEALFGELAGRYKGRPGGYTRVLKLGNRRGDAAPVSIIEFVDRPADEASE